MMKSKKGFTMLELMAVLGIVMILMAAAVPVYNDYIKNVYRDAGKQSLMELTNIMQKVKYKTFSYVSAVQGGVPKPSIYPQYFMYNGENIYKLSIPSVTASTFTLIATPVHKNMLNDGKLKVTYSSNNFVKTWDANNNNSFTQTW